MASCEGVTALVTLMSAIWSKIRVLATRFVTKGGRHGVKTGWMSEALGGGGGEGKKGIGADGDKMKESGRG